MNKRGPHPEHHDGCVIDGQKLVGFWKLSHDIGSLNNCVLKRHNAMPDEISFGRCMQYLFGGNNLYNFLLSKLENFGMQKLNGFKIFMVGLFLVSTAVDALAHGDVTPHPVDTSGLNPLGTEWIEPNPYRGNEKAISVGAVGYLHNCAGCHGLNAESGGVAPDLLKLDNDCLEMVSKAKQASCMKDTDDYFKEITLKGKKNSEGRFTMPAYGIVFTQEAVWAIKAYIDSRTLEENAKKPTNP